MRTLCCLHRLKLTDFCASIVQVIPAEHLVDIETLNDFEDAARLLSIFFARIEAELSARRNRPFLSAQRLF